MSCNTKTSLAAVIDAVNAQLNNNYVDRDDPRINQGVFTDPTIRGGLMLDENAKLDFCGYVAECGLQAPFGKQWVDSPLYPDNILVSYEDSGEIKTKWQDADGVIAVTDELVATLPIAGTTGGGRTQLDKNRENISALDFFTVDEYIAYNNNKTTFDASRPLQEFFTYIANNDVGSAYCTGVFYISTGLVAGRGSAGGQTLLVIGRLELYALNAIDTMIIFNTGQDFTWEGSVRATGTGSTNYATRTCRIGIQLGGRSGEYAPRNNFNSLQANYFSQVGIAGVQTTTLSNLGEVRANDCGSGNGRAGWSLTANWSDKVNSGSQGANAQNTTIKVDTLPPELIDTGLLMQTGGKVYNVQSVDREAGTITVFPWLDSTLAETGVLAYMFGGGLHIVGGDSSCLRALKVDLKRCGIGVWSAALYAPVLDNVVAQYCGAGMVLGLDVGSAMVGGQVNGYYCENNQFDLVINTRASLDMLIATTYAFDLNKVAYSAAARLATNMQTPQYANLRGVSIGIGGSIRNTISSPRNFQFNDVDLNMPSAVAPRSYYRDKLNINVGTLSTAFNNAFGGHTGEVVVFGTGNNSAPTGVITFNAPSGYTINGGSTIVFSGFTAAAHFTLHCEVDAKAYYVSCTTLKSSVVSSTVSYPTQTLEANTQVSTEVQLEGAVVGNIIGVALNKPLLGSYINAEVTSPGTVTIHHINNTSESVTTAAGTVTVKVI